MRVVVKIASIVAVAATLLPVQRSDADLRLLAIRAPEDCPEGLTVKSKTGDGGMLDFDISVDAEEIAHAGELYKGRVRPHAMLIIATPEQQVASVAPLGATEGKRTHYQFLTPSAAKSSELQLGVSLFEKDGFATIGGGVSMRIPLAGFAPAQR